MCPECMKGAWSARVEADGTVIDTEHAPTTQALSLEIPAGNVHRAQALIHHWHTQSSIHALRLPPEILLLRFVRYSLYVGGVHKSSATIEWGETLNLPCFLGEHTCDSHNISYTVEAAILHAGQTITSGHYTTCLHASGGTYHCDDGRTPRLAPLVTGNPHRSDEVYLLLCRRVQ